MLIYDELLERAWQKLLATIALTVFVVGAPGRYSSQPCKDTISRLLQAARIVPVQDLVPHASIGQLQLSLPGALLECNSLIPHIHRLADQFGCGACRSDSSSSWTAIRITSSPFRQLLGAEEYPGDRFGEMKNRHGHQLQEQMLPASRGMLSAVQ